MGQLVNGKWHVGWYEPDAKGAFVRPDARFRGRIGPEHPAEPGRHHLYVSYACPWAHRTIILRALRGLEDAISMTAVDPKMGDDGWRFAGDEPDPVLGAAFMRDVYVRAKPDYTGRVTVPVLWDEEKGTIVCNESREIMRMLDTSFDALAKNATSFAPEPLRAKIDEVITANYGAINDGVYRAGFAGSQAAYEEAVNGVFAGLDRNEAVLGRQRYLCGDTLTEADVALFTTLLRFDIVYFSHFKCNVRRIQDYANLWGFLRDVYQIPEVKKTCRLDHIKTHYYWSQTTVNPTRIVPVGPADYAAALETPHGRG